MHRTYINTLQHLLQAQANTRIKDWWQNYVKNGAPFRGVKMPANRSILHKWYKDFVSSTLDIEQQIALAAALIREKYTEDKLAGMIFLQEILLPNGSFNCSREINRFVDLFATGSI